MTPLIILAPYMLDHLQEICTLYRNSIKKKLYSGCKNERQAAWLQEKIILTDEVMDTINMLEGEVYGD